MVLRVILAVILAVPFAAGVLYWLDDEGPEAPIEIVRADPSDAPAAGNVPRQTARSVEPQVTFEPIPDFVEMIEPIGPEDYQDNPAEGAQILLIDQQTDARGEEAVHFFRLVGRSTHAQTVSFFSQFQPEFDPAIQSLEIHHALLTRNGEEIDMTQDVSVDFLRQEQALSSGFFLGHVSALMRIPGVRVNDVVDIAYSIRERNPVVGNQHSEVRNFYFPTPVPRYHFRSLWPRNDVVSVQLGAEFDVAVTDEGRTREFRFGPALFDYSRVEELAPNWDPSFPVFMATRFDDWQAVARWAAPYYEPQVTDSVQAIADEIMAEHERTPDRIVAALQRVQRDISYFAVLLGEGGYVPLTPDQTLRYGEGDCKAVTVLLISILEAMGIDAYAALASTSAGHGLNELAPSPLAFDHVIVAAYFNGRVFYLDPTRPEQAGRLGNLSQVDMGSVLIAREETTSLVDMVDDAEDDPEVVVNETIRILSGERNARAEVSLEWVLTGLTADITRDSIRQAGEDAALQQMGNIYLNRFQGEFDHAAGTLEDDVERNMLTYRWSGEVTLIDYGADDRGTPVYAFGAHAPAPIVVMAPIANRSSALAMPYPYHVVQTTRVEWPETAGYLRPQEQFYDIWSPTFRIESDIDTDWNSAVLRAETRVLAPYMPAEEFAQANRAMENEDLDARVMMLGGVLDVSDRERLLAGSFIPITTN